MIFAFDFTKEDHRFNWKATKQHHGKYINEVRMSKDDKYVISAAGDGIGVWDVETMELIGKVAAKDGSHVNRVVKRVGSFIRLMWSR